MWRVHMPKYFEFKISGYFLYYTSHCIIEAMHVHASDKKLAEVGSAKFFCKRQWRHSGKGAWHTYRQRNSRHS